MDRRKWHHYVAKLRPLKSRYILAAALICALTAIVSLRSNNLTVIRLRENLATVDEKNGNVEAALKELRSFIYGHMNTNLASGNNTIKPPIQLNFRYQRLVQAEKDRVSTANTAIYNDAQKHCEQLIPNEFYGRGRIPCIQEYVASHGEKEKPVNEDLYKFDFISPSWSPDLAGITIVLTGVFLILAILHEALDWWAKGSSSKKVNSIQ